MTVTIEYEYDPSYPDNPYWAKAKPDGGSCYTFGSGTSWDKARAELIGKLKGLTTSPVGPVPESETVEL